MTLANQVSDMCCNRLKLISFAGDMLATIKLNVERGILVARNDESKLNLDKIIAQWSNKLSELEDEIPDRK